MLGGDRGIVEEAEAAGDIGEGVVAGRAAERIGCRRRRPEPRRRHRQRVQALQQALSQVSAEIGQAVSAMW